MSIPYSITPNPLQPGKWRALVLRQSMTLEDFYEYCQSSSTLSTGDVKAVLDCMCRWVVESALNGREADFGDLGRTRLGIKAQVSKANQGLQPRNTLLTVSLQISRQLRRKVANQAKEGCQYECHQPKAFPRIQSVTDVSSGKDVVYTPGRVLNITGDNLKFDSERPDEGIFFQLADHTEIRAREYSRVTRKTVDVRVPEGVTGPVEVIIRNRGWSKHKNKLRRGRHGEALTPAT